MTLIGNGVFADLGLGWALNSWFVSLQEKGEGNSDTATYSGEGL